MNGRSNLDASFDRKEQRQPLPVIAGPTASGKTGLAIYLAQQLNGEVISADSMQVYRDLRIGTARPSEAEMQGVPHHLMGMISLTEEYHVARYTEQAHTAIREVAERGRLPLLCGGTGLYIRSVVDNLTYTDEPSSSTCRAQLRQRYDREGGEALLAELTKIDPETATRLHPHDAGRIIRAWELYLTTGVTMSEQRRLSRTNPSPYDPYLLVLDCRDRQVLYDRINQRVDEMVAAGLLEEARFLLTTPHAKTAIQAIGYKEWIPYFDGSLTLSETVENIKRETRRYAKRQLSWFRGMEKVHPLYIDDYQNRAALYEAALHQIQAYYKEDHR